MSKTIIMEGRYDSAVRKVVKDIMTVIKSSEGYPSGEMAEFRLPSSLDGTDEYVMEQANISFDVDVNIVRDFQKLENGKITTFDNWELYSFSIDELDRLQFNLALNSNNEPQVYSEIFMKLTEDVRHEMEHLLQEMGRGNRPFGDKEDETVFDHHSSTIEIPALVQGFYLRAKKMRLPLDKVMSDDLNKEVSDGNLNKDEAEDLLRIWTLYAKRSLPEAIYTNE